MRKTIERIINLFLRFGILKSVVKVRYEGQGVSLNDFYSGKHWYMRKRIKDKYGKIFNELTDSSEIEWMNEFMIVAFYNSRHDVDNVIGLEKILLDSIKQGKDNSGEIIRQGYCIDDSRKYYKGVCIFYDEDLPLNAFEFLIIKIK